MTDKEKDNIIVGPWTAHDKKNDEDAVNWVKKKYDKAKISMEELNRYAETVLSSPFLAVHSPRLLKKL